MKNGILLSLICSLIIFSCKGSQIYSLGNERASLFSEDTLFVDNVLSFSTLDLDEILFTFNPTTNDFVLVQGNKIFLINSASSNQIEYKIKCDSLDFYDLIFDRNFNLVLISNNGHALKVNLSNNTEDHIYLKNIQAFYDLRGFPISDIYFPRLFLNEEEKMFSQGIDRFEEYIDIFQDDSNSLYLGYYHSILKFQNVNGFFVGIAEDSTQLINSHIRVSYGYTGILQRIVFVDFLNNILIYEDGSGLIYEDLNTHSTRIISNHPRIKEGKIGYYSCLAGKNTIYSLVDIKENKIVIKRIVLNI